VTAITDKLIDLCNSNKLQSGRGGFMHPFMILAVAALGGLLDASSTSKVHALGYTFTVINVPGSEPGSTGVFGLGMNDLGQVVGTYIESAGFNCPSL
jgi:hypothetical protein